MSKRIIAMLLSLAVVASASGCVTQSDDMNLRLTKLEDQNRVLSNQMGALRPADTLSDLQSMKNEVSVLRNRLNELSSGNPNQEIAQLRAELNRLQGAVRQAHAQLGIDLAPLDAPLETTVPRMQNMPVNTPVPGTSKMSAAQGDIKTGETVTVLVNGVPHQMKVDAPSLNANAGAPTTPPAALDSTTGAAASSTAGSTTPPVPGMPDSPGKKPESILYDSASKAFSERRYKDALDSWKQFTDLYPKHTLAPNAYFWQGESSYQLQDYARAAVAYQQVIEKFPRSSKYAAALLKQGMSFLRSGKNEAGKVRLEELIKKHPKTSEADRAKKILAGLK